MEEVNNEVNNTPGANEMDLLEIRAFGNPSGVSVRL